MVVCNVKSRGGFAWEGGVGNWRGEALGGGGHTLHMIITDSWYNLLSTTPDLQHVS